MSTVTAPRRAMELASKSFRGDAAHLNSMTTFDDPYVDPATGILRNLLGAMSAASLAAAEGDFTRYRLAELAARSPVPASGDFLELQGIHRHLFQDLYEWAGQVRTVDIRKPGGAVFLPVSRIETGLGFVFEQLHADDLLRGLGRNQLVDRLAYHYDALNHAHPFREGNGRTQRAFWSRVVADAGWALEWHLVSGARNDEACRLAAEDFDLDPLRSLFDDITQPMRGVGN